VIKNQPVYWNGPLISPIVKQKEERGMALRPKKLLSRDSFLRFFFEYFGPPDFFLLFDAYWSFAFFLHVVLILPASISIEVIFRALSAILGCTLAINWITVIKYWVNVIFFSETIIFLALSPIVKQYKVFNVQYMGGG